MALENQTENLANSVNLFSMAWIFIKLYTCLCSIAHTYQNRARLTAFHLYVGMSQYSLLERNSLAFTMQRKI